MSDVLVAPGILRGRITPPPSKSDAHRALICAALAGKPDVVRGIDPPLSEDLLATKSCLAALSRPGEILDCGESGTTLRLVLPLAAAMGRPSRFVGHGRLPARPLREYEGILGPQGIKFDFPKTGSLPLNISGQLRPGCFSLRGDISSQYLSGLLLALPLLQGDSVIELTTQLESAPYVDMTIKTMRRFGVQIKLVAANQPDSEATAAETGKFIVPGGQSYKPAPYTVERDYSQAAFWLTADLFRNCLQVEGLAAGSCQGDRLIIDILAEFEAGQAEGKNSYIVDAAQIPDLVPIIAVAATQVDAVTRIDRAARLRFKESDRLASTSAALNAVGADVNETADGLEIRGGRYNRNYQPADYADKQQGIRQYNTGSLNLPVMLKGGTVDSAGDHRIAMALAVAALRTEKGITIRGAESVRKSYPDFFNEFRRLGGNADGLNLG